MKKNYYQILNLRGAATPAEIKAAFQRLALTHHPDISKRPDAESLFRDILEAYNTLSNEHTRFAYDIAMDRVPGYTFTETGHSGLASRLKSMFSFRK